MAGKNAKRIQVTPLSCPSTKPAVTIMEAICDLPELVAGESETNYKKPFKETDYTKKMRNGSNILTLHDATAHSQKMLEIIRLSGANRSALPSNMTSSGFSSCYSRLDPDKPSVTLTVNFVHPSSNKCIHPFQDRALTPREGARLQGFHDTFEFCGTRAQIVKQIGNAVPPLLGEVIAKEIAKAMGLSLQKKNLEAVV
jgi:DNA (cytosine-5)-methyltransferase 1